MDVIQCDLDQVDTITEENLNFTPCRFITEVKKVDGADFPPRTLYDIIVCVQFKLEKLGFHWKLLDDDRFKSVRLTLDNLMKKRCSDGIGNSVKQAQVITYDEENLSWEMGLLGRENPQQLVETLIFVIGMSCALRAGKEHHSLRSPGF